MSGLGSARSRFAPFLEPSNFEDGKHFFVCVVSTSGWLAFYVRRQLVMVAAGLLRFFWELYSSSPLLLWARIIPVHWAGQDFFGGWGIWPLLALCIWSKSGWEMEEATAGAAKH
jgi:hypothetical protein